jgi:hypothetical protein
MHRATQRSVVTIVFSPSLKDIYNQALPFIIMSISIIIAALVDGFSSNPQITLQEYVQYFHTYTLLIDRYADDSAIIAWFVTHISAVVLQIVIFRVFHRSWEVMYTVSQTSKWIVLANFIPAYIMIILFATFSFILLRHSGTFGSHPECNNAARVFLFTTFKASHAWFVAVAIIHAVPLALMSFLFILAIFVPFLKKLLYDKARPIAEFLSKICESLLLIETLVCSIFIFKLAPAFSTT